MLWKEGFEENEEHWDRWHVEGGVWATGSPTSGPEKAFSGARCAATVLNGDYPPETDARLVRDRVFVVPAASEQPRLRFWHWFRGGADSARAVEVKVGAGPWQAVTAASGWSSEDWTRALIDLSPFSGQTVQIAFHLTSGDAAETAAGWYIDDVVVETGLASVDFINSPEGFESGLGNWRIDHGRWEVGIPTAGPGRAFGSNCVGTVLGGNYPPGVDSRLISPEFIVPTGTENPRLRFWHWFSIWSGDPAWVEISVGGGSWTALSGPFDGNSPWTRPSFDLRPYAGQPVQIAFHFQSNTDSDVATGWYIDEVTVETGPTEWDPVAQPEGFESGLGNWSVDRGTWETGTPTAGPSAPYRGTQCAGTALARNYSAHTDSRLISPEFIVPPAAERPRLRFWHWMRNNAGDPATVEIRAAGSDWEPISEPMAANDASWARPSLDLSRFAGQRVQLGFRFQANDDDELAPGWFIDDITVETGPNETSFVNKPEGFELGLGEWAVDKGTWETGTPDTWPQQAANGSGCAGTVLLGNYGADVDSRLISPEFALPSAAENPRLRFWHWFSTFPGDAGTVEVSVAGGPWQSISAPYTGNGVVWTRPLLDLGPFAGQMVRLAFHFQSNSDANAARGWYLDDVVVETGAIDLQTLNQGDGFESGLGNWSVENGTWEAGLPRSGPGRTFKGTNCVATVLRFNFGQYAPGTDSRLVSPAFTTPCADAAPALRFAHWHAIAEGDEATVEVRVAGGDWEPILGPISGASEDWTASFVDLAAYAGKRIQIAFRFRANDDSEVSWGWYLDEVKIQASVVQTVGDTTVAEGSLFAYSFGSPCQNLQFTLGPGAPAGMSIDQALGVLVWLPTEDDGPGVYPVQVCATDVDQPSNVIECITLEVTVLESNDPPSLDPIESKTIQAAVPLEFTVTAFDPDRPGQRLRFSLEQGAPFGASIDPDTGLFRWTPTATQGTTQAIIGVRVTDDGDPPMSAVTSFSAGPDGAVSHVSLSVTRLTPELITICIEGGEMGGIYSLETCTELQSQSGPPEWNVLETFWKGEGTPCETTHSNASVTRYYRVRRVQ